MGKQRKPQPILFFRLPNHSGWWLQPQIKRRLLLGRKALTNLDSILKSRDITLPIKGPYSHSYGFSSSHIRVWQLDHNESWAPKNGCFQTVVLEKTREPLDSEEIQPVHPKGNPSWIFTGRTDAEDEAPILGPPDSEPTHWKRHDAGKDWRQEEKGRTEDETVGWCHGSMDMSLSKPWETVSVLQSMGGREMDVN